MVLLHSMKKSNAYVFLFKATVAGLAAAFVILLLRPDLLGQQRPVVELKQSPVTSTGLICLRNPVITGSQNRVSAIRTR